MQADNRKQMVIVLLCYSEFDSKYQLRVQVGIHQLQSAGTFEVRDAVVTLQ